MTLRRAVEAHTSVFPAKAGTQNLSHRREAAHRPPPCRWKEEQMSIEPPLPRHCEVHRTEATQGIIPSGPRQSPGLLRCARNDAAEGGVAPLTQPPPPEGGEG
jgi:hypothetical protein